MQKHTKTRGARLLALVLMLVMLVGLLSVSVLAANAAPTKITLVGSDEALAYEFVGYLTYALEDIPRYKVTVPAGTQKVQLYGTVHIDSSSGSGYCNEDTIDQWPAPIDYWTTDAVGSASPYTIETRIDGTSDKPLTLVKKASYGDSSSAYFLQFVADASSGGSTGGETTDASPAPTITKDLPSDTLELKYYGFSNGDSGKQSITATSTEGTLTYQWQFSKTSATEGFTDIKADDLLAEGMTATAASYEIDPSNQKGIMSLFGDSWYRVAVTNTVEGKTPTTVNSSALHVNVTGGWMRQVTFTTTKLSSDYKFTLCDGLNGTYESTPNLVDLSGDYAVYTYVTGTGDYNWTITDTAKGATRTLGKGTINVGDDQIQNHEYYLAYVYASNSSSWTGDDFTAEVKDASGNVMTPGDPFAFASYVAYPYMLAPGSYNWTLSPSKAKAADGFQTTAAQTNNLTASKSYKTWSAKLPQSILTSFTVPKGAAVEVFKPSTTQTYGKKTAVAASSVDISGVDSDVYQFALTAGSEYLYHASGKNHLACAGYLKASSSSTQAFDLTERMTSGTASSISRDVTLGAADIRLNGVDYTGSLALTSGATAQLTPLRMYQAANGSTPGSRSILPIEPDFHYSVVNVTGSNVVSVDANGKLTANSDGVALVLVTYDAMHVVNSAWTVNSNQTFSAIWPENTGVVVVEVGANASDGPAANMTLNSNSASTKLAGSNLDAEADVLYYLDGEDGARYTFTPADGSTVTLLRPTLTATAMTYSGGFTSTGVSTAADGKVTLTLTEGKNIVKISKDGADTYQVVTAKKAGLVLTNLTHEGEDFQPGDTVKVQLTGIYSPANYMVNLQSLFTRVWYTEPVKSSTVYGTKLSSYDRYLFDAPTGDQARTFTVTIPATWDASQPFTLTNGYLSCDGNAKPIGSHRRTDLSTMDASVPMLSSFALGRLPDITIPVKAAAEVNVTFNITDDAGAAVSGCKIELYRADTNDSRTLETTDTNRTISLTKGDWTYTVTKDGYLTTNGKLTVSDAAAVNITLTKLTGIRVKTMPAKTSYIEGATLDTTGLAVEGITRSGAVDIDRKLVTVAPTELTTVGTQTITVSYSGLTTTFNVTVKEDIITLTTNLPAESFSQKGSRRTFDVIARDADGNKLPVSDVKVTLNGAAVNYNWNDDVKTSYTLKFTKAGENTLVVNARDKKSLTYTINYTPAANGEVIGQAVVTVEAFTLGGGYIIEPTYVDIYEGDSTANALVKLLTERGFTYTNTGSIESSFYLATISSNQLSSIDVTGASIPTGLLEKLAEKGIDISDRSDPTTLGEFDYTSFSGWMYCHNNVFPNVGFSGNYLADGDVVRVQFTLGGYGADIGGGYAMGGGSTDYYPVANKDALTSRIAQINAEIKKNANYLKDNSLQTAYDNAMTVLEDLLSSQADVDAALTALNKTPDPKPETSYTISAGSGSTVSVGQTANVTCTVTSGTASTYNAYQLTVSYDSDKLTYTDINTDAIVSDQNGTLTIIGFGADRTCGTDNIVLTFTAKAAGTANVTITSARIDESGNASGADAPAANIAGGLTTIKVNYSVTLGEDFTGDNTVEPGKDYIFSAKDTHYDYTIDARMGSSKADVIDNGDGSYTIKNVTGNLTITATKTPKSYTVTVNGTGSADVTAAANATYLTAYTFTLTKDEAYTYEVTVTVDSTAYTPTLAADGKTYTIAGADVTGNIVITVTKDLKPVTTTEITFTGSGSADVKGGTTQTAENGKDFTFKLNADADYDYTVKLGTETLTPDADGKYTIPGAKLTGTALTVTVEKTAKQTAEVNVYEYIKLDGKAIYLVTASGTVADGKVMAYDGSAMFWSEKYKAYAYLVISNTELTKAEAAKKVTQASATKTSIAYDGDVNLTGTVDVNDAQLVWNMYNAKYADFSTVSMRKFLEADLNGDRKLTVLDAAAVITKMLG